MAPRLGCQDSLPKDPSLHLIPPRYFEVLRLLVVVASVDISCSGSPITHKTASPEPVQGLIFQPIAEGPSAWMLENRSATTLVVASPGRFAGHLERLSDGNWERARNFPAAVREEEPGLLLAPGSKWRVEESAADAPIYGVGTYRFWIDLNAPITTECWRAAQEFEILPLNSADVRTLAEYVELSATIECEYDKIAKPALAVAAPSSFLEQWWRGTHLSFPSARLAAESVLVHRGPALLRRLCNGPLSDRVVAAASVLVEHAATSSTPRASFEVALARLIERVTKDRSPPPPSAVHALGRVSGLWPQNIFEA
ncbi:MAG TPA: hypothetical protein VIV60_21230, partial [Polyangiaceae bacterium]